MGLQEEGNLDTDSKGRWLCEDGEKDWSYAAARQRRSGAIRSWKNKEEFHPRAFTESLSLLTPWFLTSSLWHSKTMHLCYFKPSILCYIVMVAQGN